MEMECTAAITNGFGNHHQKPDMTNVEEAPTVGTRRPELLWSVHNRDDHYPPMLYHPRDVDFLCDNRMVVVEGFWPYSRIQLFDMTGRPIKSIAQGEILPFGVTVDNEGYIAITDHKERTVKFFSPDGQVRLSWKPHMFDWPDGIVHTPTGHYLVTDWTRGTVSIHDIMGTQVRDFRTTDQDNSQYSCPAYVVLDHHNRIILSDTFDYSIKVFDPNGKFLHKFGRSSTNTDALIKDPRGVCIDNADNIVVADWGSKRVAVFSPEGRFIKHLLTSEDGVQYPWGIAVSNGGLIAMSEHKLDKKPALKVFRQNSI